MHYMRALLLIVGVCLLCTPPASSQGTPYSTDPSTLAYLFSSQVLNNTGSFLNWDYGCAIIFEAMWTSLGYFGNNWPTSFKQEMTEILNNKLNGYQVSPSALGYKVINNITLSWDPEVGDVTGLFPIAYLARNKYYAAHPDPNYNPQLAAWDWYIASIVSNKYVIGFPLRLPDGTYSRSGGWTGETGVGNSFVWADDSYMGTGLLSQYAILTNNASLLDSIAYQQVTFANHLRDPSDGVFRHGYNFADNHQSCCKWGRANGWLMMAHAEILLAMEKTNYNVTMFNIAKQIFIDHSTALAAFQDPATGLWHQLVNETSTFLETTGSASFLYSIAIGVRQGWLDRATFAPVVELGFKGIASTVQASGVVTGCCQGTGISTSISDYQTRSTAYSSSSPGLGIVLRAINAYYAYANPAVVTSAPTQGPATPSPRATRGPTSPPTPAPTPAPTPMPTFKPAAGANNEKGAPSAASQVVASALVAGLALAVLA